MDFTTIPLQAVKNAENMAIITVPNKTKNIIVCNTTGTSIELMLRKQYSTVKMLIKPGRIIINIKKVNYLKNIAVSYCVLFNVYYCNLLKKNTLVLSLTTSMNDIPIVYKPLCENGTVVNYPLLFLKCINPEHTILFIDDTDFTPHKYNNCMDIT